jgi:hypothetical protein
MRNSEMVIACDLFVMRSVLLPSRRLKEAAADSFFGPLWPFARSSFQFAAVQESALAQRGQIETSPVCPLLGVKRTFMGVFVGLGR